MRQNRVMTRPPALGVSRRVHDTVAIAFLALATSLVATQANAQSRERRAPAQWTPALEAEAGQLEAALAEAPLPSAGALRIRLAFGAEADLDLYVTDPLAETIYFANERAAAGGRLVADARCDSKSPRIEEIAFAAPPPGRYRVGVDYMVYREKCGAQPDVMAYVIAIEDSAGRRLLRGLARKGIFDPRKLELTRE
jgi:hypothetical protein